MTKYHIKNYSEILSWGTLASAPKLDTILLWCCSGFAAAINSRLAPATTGRIVTKSAESIFALTIHMVAISISLCGAPVFT